MTWYPDLSFCDYFRISDPPRLLAVGWLARGQSFPTGPVASEVLSKIERLADKALRIFEFRGFHTCELCGPGVDAQLVRPDGTRVPSSSHLNIFVPHEGMIFVAPQSLPHCITAHGYCPPPEFCDAVRRCPEPDDPALAEILRTVGGPGFAEQFDHLAEMEKFMARRRR